MSGTLREKLEAIAAARFDGYELFENDLIQRVACRRCRDFDGLGRKLRALPALPGLRGLS
jgi:sugar phosphate isomerase/epimerase